MNPGPLLPLTTFEHTSITFALPQAISLALEVLGDDGLRRLAASQGIAALGPKYSFLRDYLLGHGAGRGRAAAAAAAAAARGGRGGGGYGTSRRPGAGARRNDVSEMGGSYASE
jgi:hypothetical protein